MCKKSDIDPEKFEKQYAYNIRHSYGKEGKRADYTPWGCAKIINHQPPGQGEYHGCPFKVFDESQLVHLLQTYGVQGADLKVILEKKKEKQF